MPNGLISLLLLLSSLLLVVVVGGGVFYGLQLTGSKSKLFQEAIT